MDSRPPNTREGAESWCGCLANATLLGAVELGAEEDLRMSGQDIKDFFYQFVIGDFRAARNCLVGRLSQKELAEIFPEKADLPAEGGYVGPGTMAMGDLCAVEFAQCVHLPVVLQAKVAAPFELLRLRSPPPPGAFVLGLVTDDLVKIGLRERLVEGRG